MPDIIGRGHNAPAAKLDYYRLCADAGIADPPEPVVEYDAGWFTARAASLSSSPEGR